LFGHGRRGWDREPLAPLTGDVYPAVLLQRQWRLPDFAAGVDANVADPLHPLHTALIPGHQPQGERPQALIALEHALRLAEPEGYVRLFADLGLPLARLLQAAQARAVLPDYVAALLAAFGEGLPSPALEPLPEPLTAREQEVLELLAAGLTNRQIAEQLVISPQTVKKHTGNIYGKLGVTNRTEAVARAREVGLLE
jgi:DNA-binding CsgD family transcriptional regulator